MTLFRFFHPAIFLVILLICSPACKTSNTIKGGTIGGVAGGVIGGVIGKKAGNTAVGIIIGAAVGGAAGALIGRYMDKQAEEIRQDMKGAQVERVGEGILITFDSGLMFDVDSYQLKSVTRKNLAELSDILNKYDDTEILIEGHTDDTGTLRHNQTLSENRAESVSRYLIREGIISSRMSTVGYGEEQPVADNNTNAGRKENRRVEVAIYANKKLKRAAKRGEVGL